MPPSPSKVDCRESGNGATTAEIRGLRLLSLDGGGVRGLSSLIILRRIMYNLKPSDNLYDIARPSDYFDMICGTSTGGLIAIMLGRLGMSVQEAIDAYLILAKDVFHEAPLYRVPGSKWIVPLVGKSRFSGDKLTCAIQHLAEVKTGQRDAAMLDTREDACRVFVCATRTANTEPVLLRSYRSDGEEGSDAAIWQVARATSAAPTFFSPITFGSPPAEYVDGAILHNNPIRLLMREADRIWGLAAPLACVVSIGTGIPPVRKLGFMGHQVLYTCAKLATSAEIIARNFHADQGEKLQREGKYFRFSVATGLQGIGLEEWRAFDLMDAATKTYLEDIHAEIQACSERLRDGGDTSAPLEEASVSRHPSDTTVVAEEDSSPLSVEVPYPEYVDISHMSSPYFTGRTNILASIESYFLERKGTRSLQTAVLIGLGGVGKTQIALRYFEQQRARYAVALFVGCSTEQEAITAFIQFANLIVDEELRLRPTSNYDEAAKRLGFSGLLGRQAGQSVAENNMRIVRAVQAWFGRQRRRFLVILDNADDPEAVNLARFIPRSGAGDIVITTRDADAKAFGQPFYIDEMSQVEAIAFLSRASHLIFDTQEQRDAAAQAAEALGYLPLALDLACGYLSNSGSDITSFLSTYAAHAKSLLSKAPNDGMLGYKRSAFTTWEMSFERLLAISPASAALLQHLGFVHCQDICEPLYNPAGGEGDARGGCWGLREEADFGFGEAFASLAKLSLIRRDKRSHTYEIHKVVHVWIRERLDKSLQATYGRGAAVGVARALPYLTTQGELTASRKIHRRLYPHIETCWANVEAYVPCHDDEKDVELMDALGVIASSFQHQGQYSLAEKVFLRAYRGNQLCHGPRARKTLDTISSLAAIYELRGDLKKSEDHYRLALEGFADVLGADHKVTLAVLYSLAGVVKYRGKSDEAEKLYKQALQGRQKLGHDHPDTLETIEALASLFYDLRRTADAEPLQLAVLDARERILGPCHPNTLRAALNMGILYSGAGKSELALKLFDKAYESRETLLTLQSPEAFNALSMIAALYANIGHVKKAESLYREILLGQQMVLGDLHPDTVWTLNHLNIILFPKERSPEVVRAIEQSASDLNAALGAQNLDTLWVSHNLAMVYAFLGRFDEAEALQGRVVEGYRAELGPDHINTLYMVNDLGDCYLRAGKFEKAEELLRTAFKGKLKYFGPKSQYTLYTATFLACTMKEQGKFEQAEELYVETLAATTETLGEEHSAVWMCMMYLADLYVERQRWREAADLYEKLLNLRGRLQGEMHENTRHVRELFEETKRRIGSPYNSKQVKLLSRPARNLPSGFGFRARNDTVQVLF